MISGRKNKDSIVHNEDKGYKRNRNSDSNYIDNSANINGNNTRRTVPRLVGMDGDDSNLPEARAHRYISLVKD